MPKTTKESGAMPDNEENNTEETTEVTEGNDATSETLGEGGKSAIQKERAAAKKAADENKALIAKLKEYEDRDKTDAEKAADALKSAEKRAAEAETKLLRMEVAASKGLKPNQAKFLTGDSKEDMEARADELLEAFTPGDKQDNGREKPTENLRPGSSTDSDGDDDSFDAESLASDIRGSNRI